MSRPNFDVKESYTGTGSLSAYTFDFKIEDLEYLEIVEVDNLGVETQRVRGTDVTYLSSVTFDAIKGGGTVNLAANLVTDYKLIILMANDEPTQTYEFKNKTSLDLSRFESALDLIAGALQRLSFFSKKTVRIHDLDNEALFDPSLPPGVATSQNKVLTINSAGTGIEYGPDAAAIAGAEASATAAASSASAASTSETNAASSETAVASSASAASTSETNAASSETAVASSASAASTSETNAASSETAAASSASAASTSETNAASSETAAASSASAASTSETNAASSETAAASSASSATTSAATATAAAAASQWRDVVFVNNGDSPITIVNADTGKLYVADTSSGAVVFNLPAISAITLTSPWSIGIKKSTSDSNVVTVNRASTDTIDGLTSNSISIPDGGAQFIPDDDPSPDEWTTLPFGAVLSTETIDSHTPTFSASWDTPTGVDIQTYRINKMLFMTGVFTTGSTTTGVEAQIGLPSGLTVASEIGDLVACGSWLNSVTSVDVWVPLMTGGDAFFNLTTQASGTPRYANGANVCGNNATQSFSVMIPIEEW